MAYECLATPGIGHGTIIPNIHLEKVGSISPATLGHLTTKPIRSQNNFVLPSSLVQCHASEQYATHQGSKF